MASPRCRKYLRDADRQVLAQRAFVLTVKVLEDTLSELTEVHGPPRSAARGPSAHSLTQPAPPRSRAHRLSPQPGTRRPVATLTGGVTASRGRPATVRPAQRPGCAQVGGPAGLVSASSTLAGGAGRLHPRSRARAPVGSAVAPALAGGQTGRTRAASVGEAKVGTASTRGQETPRLHV